MRTAPSAVVLGKTEEDGVLRRIQTTTRKYSKFEDSQQECSTMSPTTTAILGGLTREQIANSTIYLN